MSKINIKECVKDAKNNASEPIYLGCEDYNGTTFMYIKDPRAMYSNNVVISASCCISDEFAPKTYCILTDSIFEKMPTNYQLFMIEHEKAHCLFGHLEFNEYKVLRRFLPNSKEEMIEYEADSKAASNIGKDIAIGALRWMIDNISLSLSSKMEIKRRIRRLKKVD